MTNQWHEAPFDDRVQVHVAMDKQKVDVLCTCSTHHTQHVNKHKITFESI
jgi:hypothetical protein